MRRRRVYATHRLAFVRAEIVHDDYIPRLEGRRENLLDVEEKSLAVDRSVDQPRRVDAIAAQRGQEGHGLPVMGWTPPDGIDVPEWRCFLPLRGGAHDGS